MTIDLEVPRQAHPTQDQLLEDFGEEYLSIQSLFRFCFVPGGRLNLMKELSLDEDWGQSDFVLLKYLAVQIRLAIEQGRYIWNGDQIVLCAGRLVTPTGAPIYAGIVRNSTPDENPWVLNWVGERPSCAELPEPPDLGHWPELKPGLEVVIACDLDDEERRTRLPYIADAPLVTRLGALSGAIQWSLFRGLAVPQIHGGGRGYFVPVYLSSREDVSCAPELVAPVVTQGERLIVRTLLDPHVAYSPARAVVERCEQLPNWLLDSWDNATEASRTQDEDDSE
ncbi:MAG: hypothetical protein O7B99_04695 [Planctomycetota bacterium]|nr:hypothetical protein [Planctomycetota bacterium]